MTHWKVSLQIEPQLPHVKAKWVIRNAVLDLFRELSNVHFLRKGYTNAKSLRFQRVFWELNGALKIDQIYARLSDSPPLLHGFRAPFDHEIAREEVLML